MKTFGLLFYLLGVSLIKDMSEDAMATLQTSGDHPRPSLFCSDDPQEEEEEDQVASSTPSPSASETQDDDDDDDDEILTLGPLSPTCNWCGDEPKLLQMIPLGESRPPGNERPVMRFTRHCSASGGYYDSRIISSSLIPMNAPVNLSISDDHLYSRLNSHRRTRSLGGYYNHVFVKYAPNFRHGKPIVPFGKQINGCSETNHNAHTLGKGFKSPLVVGLNSLEESICTDADRATTRRADNRDEQQLGELARCPSLLGHNSLQQMPAIRGGGRHPAMRRSGSRISDVTYLSCSSSLSTCSYESASTQYSFISQAVLRCLWHKGTPYLVYTMADDLDRVYVATRWKVKSPDDRALDHIYMFYSKTGHRSAAPHASVSPYRLVGKMKVSSCVTFVSSRSSIKETEFVLFGSAQHDHRKQLPPSKPAAAKNHGFSKNLFHVLRTTNSRPPISVPSHGDSSSPEFQVPVKDAFIDELNQFLSDPACHGNLQPRNEMVAVVIRTHQSDTGREMVSGGWGLKFLEKQTDATVDSSPEVSYHHHHSTAGKPMRIQTVNVLIPAGLHGGAQSGSVGPSSLVERWKTGGKCDCGGWDLGCPITVLGDRSTNGNSCSEETPIESCKTMDLFLEGSNQADPAMRVVDVQECLYVVYAQANISPLQSFSIAVSMMHSQIPTLCPC